MILEPNNDIYEEEIETLTSEEKEDLEYDEDSLKRISHTSNDFDVYGLVRRLNNNSIIVPRFNMKRNEDIDSEKFQRGFVWKKSQIDRFIESVLMEFPIPGVFLVKQENNKNLVLDGQQRLESLRIFLNKKHRLGYKNIDPSFQGKTFDELPEEYQRSFEDYTIQTTTIQTYPLGDISSIYQIYERINAGGTQLSAHEIRIALFSGPIVEYISGLNELKEWRALYSENPNKRLRDHELISKIISFYLDYKSYDKPLKKFISNFYEKNKEEVLQNTLEAGEIFKKACKIIEQSKIGREALRPTGKSINNAWSDAMFVGVMNRIKNDSQYSSVDFENDYNSYSNIEQSFYVNCFRGATSDRPKVDMRMDYAMKCFASKSDEND